MEESETLLLRRKFFYSDQNVDSRDPVQLNLLYVQVISACLTLSELDGGEMHKASSGGENVTFTISLSLCQKGTLSIFTNK